MVLPFFNRDDELRRMRRAFDAKNGNLVCILGRRRLGKSRMLGRALDGRKAVYYAADEGNGAVQRHALAREMDRVVPGMAAVTYPGWFELLDAWWRQAPTRSVLAIDEFPWLAASSPELPGILQKLIDRRAARHVALCGSSTRMMHGLVLHGAAPLYGRATEILRLQPLAPHWAARAFKLQDPAEVVERCAVWGGVPRYWELAADWRDHWQAVEALVLDPNGVLHEEPRRLLADELADAVRPASVLTLVGQGCHRVSELAGRLGVPSTSLSRPLALLVELGLLRREIPFGTPPRDAKRSLYRIDDPLLDFSARFVEPNRSRLQSGQSAAVCKEVRAAWPQYLGLRWEQMVRARIARAPVFGTEWASAERYWDGTRSASPLELDAVAVASGDPRRVLVVECKLSVAGAAVDAQLESLRRKTERCAALAGKRVEVALWALRASGRTSHPRLLTARDLVGED